MVELTSGWLVRDNPPFPHEPSVHFFFREDSPWMASPEGNWHYKGMRTRTFTWGVAAWCDIYDLKPPKPGECFECDVEL